jgi:aminoglycoside phosphotransferase (APT) family kinase protein
MELAVGERLGFGRAAEVFECGEGRVLKLLRDPNGTGDLDREMLAQRAAVVAGIRAPATYEILEHDGRKGLLMERIEGLDGLTAAEKQPWRIWSLAREVGRLHRSIASVAAPSGLLGFHQLARHDIATSARVPEAARARLLAVLEVMPEGNHLCHMDFHLGNVIVGPEGPVVIDFASARRGDPVADHVKSLLLLEAGSPPEMGLSQRLLVLFGRKLARAAYVRGYGNLTAAEQKRATLWWPVIIGQRLVQGIPEERPKLLKSLSARLRDAERELTRHPI